MKELEQSLNFQKLEQIFERVQDKKAQKLIDEKIHKIGTEPKNRSLKKNKRG